MNFNKIVAIVAIVVIGVVSGCQSQEWKVSEDGYEYKYIEKGSGNTPEFGEVVLYNMVYKNENDSIIDPMGGKQPFMIPCDSAQWADGGVLYKALATIKQGDSILIKIPTKKLFDESFKSPVPPSLNPDGSITFYIGATKVMSQDEARAEAQKIREKMQAEMMAQRMEDRKKQMELFLKDNADKINAETSVIDEYLAKNNITAQSHESGLRYVIDEEGTGNYPQPGDNVKVHYKGTLLDGTEFDSSLDGDDPIEFPIGTGSVIMGWDIGIALLKPGGKGTIYIPSQLAYGEQARGEIIKPNSILKFDVELLEIN